MLFTYCFFQRNESMRELAELRRVTATASSSGPRSKSQSLPDPVYASIRPSRAYRTLPGPAPLAGPAPDLATASESDYSVNAKELKVYTTEISVTVNENFNPSIGSVEI